MILARVYERAAQRIERGESQWIGEALLGAMRDFGLRDRQLVVEQAMMPLRVWAHDAGFKSVGRAIAGGHFNAVGYPRSLQDRYRDYRVLILCFAAAMVRKGDLW
jgi:hypothetical protein